MRGIVKGGNNDGGASVLTGDALVAEVIDGKFFYSDDPASKLEGTMPNNAGDVNAVSYHADGTSLHIVPATGYTDGSDDATVITDANYIAGNISDAVTIFGKQGTLSGGVSLTGDAAVGDVVLGKTFYNTNAKSQQVGTYQATYRKSELRLRVTTITLPMTFATITAR